MLTLFKTLIASPKTLIAAAAALAVLGGVIAWQTHTIDNLKTKTKAQATTIADYKSRITAITIAHAADQQAQRNVLVASSTITREKEYAHALIKATKSDCVVDPGLADIFAGVQVNTTTTHRSAATGVAIPNGLRP